MIYGILAYTLLLLGAATDTAPAARVGAPDPVFAVGQPSVPLQCKGSPATIVFASTAREPGGGTIQATCSEDCNELPDIQCTGSVCNAVSRDCSEFGCERGSVTCDGNTTFCSQACPPNCSFFECRQPCKQPGCVATCLDLCTCECETICQ
jgi:hypothetical protein